MGRVKTLSEAQIDRILQKYKDDELSRRDARASLVNRGLSIDDAENILGAVDDEIAERTRRL